MMGIQAMDSTTSNKMKHLNTKAVEATIITSNWHILVLDNHAAASKFCLSDLQMMKRKKNFNIFFTVEQVKQQSHLPTKRSSLVFAFVLKLFIMILIYSITLFRAVLDILYSRRKMYTKEKAKVVAAVQGTELIQFHATLQ